MVRPKSLAPQMVLHVSGQSVVRLDGVDYYLGKHQSAESFARYAVLLRAYQDGGLSMPDDFDFEAVSSKAEFLFSEPTITHQIDTPLTVSHILGGYETFADKRYGVGTELARIKKTCSDIIEADGQLLAASYGPKALLLQRQRWVESGKSRQYCNRLTNLVIRIFKWAVSQELVDQSSWVRLKSIDPLKFGQSEAHEPEPVKPVSVDIVIATLPHLGKTLAAMVRLQVATGMRPSELCRIRPIEIDKSGTEWVYRPLKHKNVGKGKTRSIPIVGEARATLEPFMVRP